MTDPSPKYSEKLRKLFNMINPYHVSCVYKAAYDEHATQMLCMLDEISLDDRGDANNVSSSDIQCENDIYCENPQRKAIRRFFKSNEDGPPKNNVNEHELHPWQTCLSTSCENSCSLSKQKERSNLTAESTPNQTKNSSNGSSKPDFTSNRQPFGSFLNGFTYNSESRPNSNHTIPKAKSCSSASSAKLSSKPKASGDVVPIIQHANSAPVGQRDRNNNLKQKVHRNRKAMIKYPMVHSPHGHIQKYRESVTRQNLRSALLDCAHRYYAKRDREAKCVPKVHVECADVREGACIKPSLKVAKYKFDVGKRFLQCKTNCEATREMPVVSCNYLSTGTCSSLNVGSILSPVVLSPPPPCISKSPSRSGRLSSKQSITDSLIAASPPIGCSSDDTRIPATNKPGSALGPNKPSSPLHAMYTRVNRSRPSIPSNSRGQVYAASVETGPAHVVSASGKSAEPKPIQLSFVPPKMPTCSSASPRASI